MRWRDLGAAKQIDDQIDAYRLALRDPKRSDARQLARELDEKIMQPVRSMGAAGRHLIISPDGELNLLPFESLLDEHGHYLIENYLISYVTAGRDLLRMQVARPGKSEPEIFANPAFGEPATEQIAASSPAKLGPAKALPRVAVPPPARISPAFTLPLSRVPPRKRMYSNHYFLTQRSSAESAPARPSLSGSRRPPSSTWRPTDSSSRTPRTMRRATTRLAKGWAEVLIPQ